MKFTSNPTEVALIDEIVKRACSMFPENNALDLLMDLSACNMTCPLKLEQLLNADNFNFTHDVFGIRNHINRKSGKLKHEFLPRFAQ